MEFVRNSEGIAIGIILNPDEKCNCEAVKKEIPESHRTWCSDCIY